MGQERKSYVSKNVLGCGAVRISSDKESGKCIPSALCSHSGTLGGH